MDEAGDTLTDFSKGAGDKLDLSQLFSSLGLHTNPFAAGYLRTTQVGADVRVDIDSNGGANSFVPLATIEKMTTLQLSNDFVIWS